MARYGYVCPACGPFEVLLPMGTAPDTAYHQIHWGQDDPGHAASWQICPERAVRVLHLPHYTADQRRFRTGISPVTRRPYAQTRAEEAAIEKDMNIEFVTPESRPAEWKEAEQYHRHLAAGGEPVPWSPKVAPIAPGTLLREYEKRAKP